MSESESIIGENLTTNITWATVSGAVGDAVSKLVAFLDPVDAAMAASPLQQSKNYQAALADLKNQNVQAMLKVIAMGESGGGGVPGAEDYYEVGGGGSDVTPSQLSSFPYPILNTPVGAYQFLFSTYAIEVSRLGITSFTPTAQDIMAVDDLIRHGVMATLLQPVVTQNDFNAILPKIAGEWASLPEGPPIDGVKGTGLDHSHYSNNIFGYSADWSLFQSFANIK